MVLSSCGKGCMVILESQHVCKLHLMGALIMLYNLSPPVNLKAYQNQSNASFT